MKRRLVLTLVPLALVGGAWASSASAAPDAPKRHIVCVFDTPDQDGYCVTVMLPVQPQR